MLDSNFAKRTVLLLTGIVFCVLILLPVCYAFISSFLSEGHLSFKNYLLLLEKRQISLFLRSLYLAGSTALIALLLGLISAFLVQRTDLPAKNFFKIAYLIPLAIAPYINAVAWVQLLGKNGHINAGLTRLFNLQEPLFNIYGFWGAVFVLGLSYFPLVMLFTLAGLSNLDRSLEETARLISPPARVLTSITLPLILPLVLSGAGFVFILALFNFGVPALLRVNVFIIEVFTEFSAFFNFPRAAAASVPLFAIAILSMALLVLYFRKKSHVTVSTYHRPLRITKLDRWKIPAVLFCSLLLLIAVVFPLSTLFIQAGRLKSFLSVWKISLKNVFNSLAFASLGAVVAVALGFFTTCFFPLRKKAGFHLINFLAVGIFSVPPTVVGIALIKFWNRPGSLEVIYTSFLIIVIAYVVRFVPLALAAASFSLNQIHPNLEESARICGISWWRVFYRITLRLIRPAFIVALMLVFIFAMGELAATILVYPPGCDTLPIRLFTLMHYESPQLVAALAVIWMVVTLLPVIIFYRLTQRQWIGFRWLRSDWKT